MQWRPIDVQPDPECASVQPGAAARCSERDRRCAPGAGRSGQSRAGVGVSSFPGSRVDLRGNLICCRAPLKLRKWKLICRSQACQSQHRGTASGGHPAVLSTPLSQTVPRTCCHRLDCVWGRRLHSDTVTRAAVGGSATEREQVRSVRWPGADLCPLSPSSDGGAGTGAS